MTQLALGAPDVDVPDHRVRALAGILAGFGWPGRGSFEKLTKPQQETTLRAARAALVEVYAHAMEEELR